MRKILKDRHEVAHFWANKVQSEGQAGNVFFRDSTIYSYGSHFAIATHIAPGIVAFTNRNYSPSTGQHKSIVRNAIAEGVEIVYVANPSDGVNSNKSAAERSIEQLVITASKARRQSTRSAPLAEAFTVATNFNRFAQVMKSRERINTTKLNIGSIEQLKTFVADKVKREARAAKALEKKRAEIVHKNRVAWRQHEIGYMPMYSSGATMLRLSKDNEIVQTSANAEIPVAEAIKLWPFIQRVMRGDKDYEVGMSLGNYRLTQIKQNGDIVVGCHNIPFAEIEGIAHELDLTNTSAASRAFERATA